MKISVVVPVLNEQDNILVCLKHISAQTRPADEIIVVDNGSTDDTMPLIRKHFPQVRILHETVKGTTPARNKGFNNVRGDIIARTDADTRVPRSWLKRIETNFHKKEIDAVTGPLVFYDLKGSSTMTMFKAYMRTMYRMLDFHLLHGPNFAIKKEMWSKVKDKVCLDDREVHEDYDLSIHIHKQGGIIQYDPRLTVPASSRRIKHDPVTFFIEYPIRLAKTIRKHYPLREQLNKKLIKKL